MHISSRQRSDEAEEVSEACEVLKEIRAYRGTAASIVVRLLRRPEADVSRDRSAVGPQEEGIFVVGLLTDET